MEERIRTSNLNRMVEYMMTGGKGEDRATKEEWEEAQRISMQIQPL